MWTQAFRFGHSLGRQMWIYKSPVTTAALVLLSNSVLSSLRDE